MGLTPASRGLSFFGRASATALTGGGEFARIESCEIVGQPLDRMDRGIAYLSLSDLGEGRERHTRFQRGLPLWNATGIQMRHHVVVEGKVLFHGYILRPYMAFCQ